LVLRRFLPSAYRPVLANRVFRRLILGFAVSYLGDGMSFVAVAWLAIELAPQATAGLWVGGAVAAYTLPGVVGALVFGRRLRRVPARRLLLADNVVRGVFLGAVPLAWLAGLLTLPLYVVLLAVSSLLHAWGSAGTYTVLAELLPDEQRLAANTLVGSLNFAATIAGPAIAGVLVTYVSSALVLGLDALTYVFLAVLVVRTRLPESGHVSPVDRAAARGGLALLRSHPELLGLLTLTWFFNLLYGPVEVALPLHVTEDLHAPGTLLGLYWMLFGIGAVLGGLAVGALRQLPLWPVTIRDRGRLGSLAAAVRARRADGRHPRVLHARRRDLRTVRSALGDAHAGAVATAAPGADARSPQRGAPHRIAARHGARRTAHHGAGPASDARWLGTRHRGAGRRRVRRAVGSAYEAVSARACCATCAGALHGIRRGCRPAW
jgi:MFS family permease